MKSRLNCRQVSNPCESAGFIKAGKEDRHSSSNIILIIKFTQLKQGIFFVCLFYKFIYLFIFGCAGSSLLCEGFLQPRRAGATLHRGARASHRRGPSHRGAQAPDAQAQQLRPTGPATPRHVGSSRTGTRTRVPRTGRRTPNHCATREAPSKGSLTQV